MPKLETERKHLAQADLHVAGGERRIVAQMALIARLRRDKQETVTAEELLLNLQQTLQVWKAHRDEILREITRLERTPSR